MVEDMDIFDVVIVGAGVSGLACARKVLEGRPATRLCVVDARDRVGGGAEYLIAVK